MSHSSDPFDRALEREAQIRSDNPARRDRRDILTVSFGFAVVLSAWGALLAFHWFFLRGPRWLAVIHVLAWGASVLCWLFIVVMGIVATHIEGRDQSRLLLEHPTRER